MVVDYVICVNWLISKVAASDVLDSSPCNNALAGAFLVILMLMLKILGPWECHPLLKLGIP